MLILAIDTALTACSVAVYDTSVAQVRAVTSEAMDKGHAEALMPMVAQCLKQAGVSVRDCGMIATTTGPGSFTGLRVGISAVRGLSLACSAPCIGIDTLEALAAPLLAADITPVASCIDARHGHVFFVLRNRNGLLIQPCLVSIDEAAAVAGANSCRLVGSGARAVAAVWPIGKSPPLAVDERAAPDIVAVAQLAATRNPTTSPARPLYLRAPDAKPSTHLALARQ